MTVHAYLKNEFTEDKKCQNLHELAQISKNSDTLPKKATHVIILKFEQPDFNIL